MLNDLVVPTHWYNQFIWVKIGIFPIKQRWKITNIWETQKKVEQYVLFVLEFFKGTLGNMISFSIHFSSDFSVFDENPQLQLFEIRVVQVINHHLESFPPFSSWWLNQPILRNICDRQTGSFPQVRALKKNVWNHHLVFYYSVYIHMGAMGVDHVRPNGIIFHRPAFPWNSRRFPETSSICCCFVLVWSRELIWPDMYWISSLSSISKYVLKHVFASP